MESKDLFRVKEMTNMGYVFLVEIAVGEFARMLEWLGGNLRSLCGSCNSLDVHAHKSSRYVSPVSEVHNANTPCYTTWQHPED